MHIATWRVSRTVIFAERIQLRMSGDDAAADRARLKRLLHAILLFGGAIPVVVLGLLYGGSRIVGIDFGRVVFGLTGLTTLAWLLFAGWGRRMDAARPSGELGRNSATDYGKEVSQGRFVQIPLPVRLVFVLTGTVLLGWLVVIATL